MSKKDTTEEPKIYLGKVSKNLKMGIVGLPNVGKSSFFNLLCSMEVPAENFPFCTIDPTTSRVQVPDERFDWLVQQYKPKSVVPAFLSVTDIAGLVRGASEGAGLGNEFLSHIKAVDGIFHLCRAFDDTEIQHVEGEVDPVRDMDIISKELILKDLEWLEKYVEPLRKVVQSTQKNRKQELETLEKCLALLKEGKEIRTGHWKSADVEHINARQFITAKPIVYLVNLSEQDYIRKRNKWLPKIAEWVKARDGSPVIPFSVPFEVKLSKMDAAAKEEYMKSVGATSMVPKIIRTGYHAIHLIYFFTAGSDEVRAWTIHEGMKAPEAAGTIHGDFEKGFIMAEVTPFKDLKELGTEAAVRAAGKLIMGGKGYVVQDGDIMLIKANTVGLAPKKK